MTSDLFTSTMERAAFSQAFGFERRVGLSAQYKGKALLLQGGIFGANADDLTGDSNDNLSVDARAVWMPKLGDTQVRSEERRVGQECVSTCRSGGSAVHYKKKN